MIVDKSEVYTPQETISILKISDSTFRRLIKKGALRVAKVGGQYRILGREILHLLSPKLEDKARGIYRKVKEKIRDLEK
jgi:excisionase family DNA binding protein